MQVTVPWSEYGACEYFIPTPLRDWIVAHGLDDRFCGGGSWGNGFDANGITNRTSIYVVDNIQEEDSVAFKLMFPKCEIYVSKQYSEN